MPLTLYNTLSRRKEEFTPINAANVRMYVCGPTVYDRAHLGNARSVVVYDILYRLLCYIYGAEHVQYVRNITDVDDKINAAAKARGISIGTLTEEMTRWFHSDMDALGNYKKKSNDNSGLWGEPHATHHIGDMINMIERLINNGSAYIAGGNVMFAVRTLPDYGKLSGRVQDELEAGKRIAVESYKRDSSDFVLWKPASPDDDASSIFDSPWGKGRPGWHIECSAMATRFLGNDFDIHGGGADLMFPHHENEIAQSTAAYPGSHYARFWVHNGFLTVNGEKMSKSLGNFITVKDLLDKGIHGEVIRYALLKTKYREPLDWSDKLVEDAKKELDGLYRQISNASVNNATAPDTFLEALSDDMNVPRALSLLHAANASDLKVMGALLGILQQDPEIWFKGAAGAAGLSEEAIQAAITARNEAKKSKNWAEADRIRSELKAQGVLLEDKPGGVTDWRRA